jgi:macrolide transport system ATP-binding/permease protein
LTLLLLAGAGFMMRAFFRAYSARPNVNTLHVWAMRVALPRVTYRTPEQRVAFVRQLEERLGRLDLVAAGSITSAVPFEPAPRRELAIDLRAPMSGSRPPSVPTVTIGGGFFETLNVHLARGREFTNLDGTPGREAAIVNERFAAVYFPGEDPIGHRIRLTDPNAYDAASAPWVTVVGVSPTVRRDVTSDGDPIVYLPYGAQPGERWAVLVRAAREPDAVVPLVRDEVRALDPDLPLFDIKTLDKRLAFLRWPEGCSARCSRFSRASD